MQVRELSIGSEAPDMEPEDRAAFVDAYTKVLTSCWSSEDFAQKLENDPHAALAEGGLRVPAGAEVEIVRNVVGEPDLEQQIALWIEGGRTGRYLLHVPATPRIYTRELTDNDLGSVAGGSGGASCSCCPCSCST
jgi:hypothetical protein